MTGHGGGSERPPDAGGGSEAPIRTDGGAGSVSETDGGMGTVGDRDGGAGVVTEARGGAGSVTAGEDSEERGVTVLHVDDDPGVGELVAHFLQESVPDVSVVTETESARALDRAARGDVDCVVTDLDMPGMDGLDLARALDATHPEVPVVLFTSRDWEAVAGAPGTAAVTAHVRKEGGHRQFQALAGRVQALLD